MRYLIVLEPTEEGFSVQVPDLAILTHGETVEAAKLAAVEAIQVNLDAYRETHRAVPLQEPALTHLENPDFEDLLFAYVDVEDTRHQAAA